MAEDSRSRTPLTKRALSALYADRWQTTMQVASALGIRWRPGSHDLRPVREALYALLVAGVAEQEAEHSGHRWRRVAS